MTGLTFTSPTCRTTSARGRRSTTARRGAPSHILVEELMIRANEAVAGLLAGRRREALFRVHERPDPQAVELLLAKLADLAVPTPPAPEDLSPADAARIASDASDSVAEYV